MKEVYRDISHPAFPYCKTHNRLFPHYTVGWLTPARPEELHVFQALCDLCKGDAQCFTAPSMPVASFPVSTAGSLPIPSKSKAYKGLFP
jgi:hypothetical protein